jgi:uncharacterized protein (TIGR02611 family)
MELLLSQARKIVIGVVGVTVLLIGIAMLVLPGPGWVVIFVGLAMLATEFVWAKRLLKKAKETAVNAKDKVFGGNSAQPAAGENPYEPSATSHEPEAAEK